MITLKQDDTIASGNWSLHELCRLGRQLPSTCADRSNWSIRAGKLHCQQQSMQGNPRLRLLRREVEAFVKEKHGANYLRDQQAKTELAHINRELRQLKAR